MEEQNKQEQHQVPPQQGATTAGQQSGTQAGAAPAQEAVQNKTLMGILAYVGPLVIIPFLMSKDDPFVKFHIKQGLVLVALWLILWVLMSMFWMMFMVWQIAQLAVVALSVVGIVNVVQNHEKELPFVGQFAKHMPV